MIGFVACGGESATAQPRNRATAQPRNRATAQPRNRATAQPRNRATAQPRNRAISGNHFVSSGRFAGRAKIPQTSLASNFRSRKMPPTMFGVFFAPKSPASRRWDGFFCSTKPGLTTLRPHRIPAGHLPAGSSRHASYADADARDTKVL
jgi:hypothetical protein